MRHHLLFPPVHEKKQGCLLGYGDRPYSGDIVIHEHSGFSVRFVKNECIGLGDAVGQDRLPALDIDDLSVHADVNFPKGSHGGAKCRNRQQ